MNTESSVVLESPIGEQLGFVSLIEVREEGVNTETLAATAGNCEDSNPPCYDPCDKCDTCYDPCDKCDTCYEPPSN